MLVPRPPHDAHRRRVGRRAPTPTITTDRRLARPCGEQKFGSLRACRMLCDVWTLARNARKLAFHPWARGRTAVVGSLCDAPIGSSTSSPATSQHGSSLDGSLLSMLSAFCTASPSSLGRSAGPGRAVSGAAATVAGARHVPVGRTVLVESVCRQGGTHSGAVPTGRGSKGVAPQRGWHSSQRPHLRKVGHGSPRNFLANTRAPPSLGRVRCGRTSNLVIVPRRAA